MAGRGTTSRVVVAAAAVAAIALVTAAMPALAAKHSAPRGQALHARLAMGQLEVGVLQQLNAIRVAHGLASLILSPALNASSMQHSREMAADGYFAHASADGTVFWKRIQRWYGPAGHASWSVGENLLWSSPDVD